MTQRSVPGGARVSTRALVDIVRPAVVGSYGVTGFASRSLGERLLGWLRLADPGIRVSARDGLRIDLHLTVAFGLPVAEVARQAESAVRYAIRTALGREVDRLTIHVGGMRYGAAEPPPPASTPEPDALAGLETLAVAEATNGKGRRAGKSGSKREGRE